MPEKKIIAVAGATGSQGGGLVRAILDEPDGEFAVRALVRDPNSDRAKALAERGAEIVQADLNDPASIEKAFRGAYGVYCVTFYWEHFDPPREVAHARTMAEAARDARVRHAIWSTLEDSRNWVPLDDERMPTLKDRFKVPHFDAKAEANRFFVDAGVPTTFIVPSFYWENLIFFGMGPRPGPEGTLSLTFPMGDRKLAGIACEDIGRCALGIFSRGDEYVGKFVGVAGDHRTGDEMATILAKALGREIGYSQISPDAYRKLDFPGAEDLGNMFQLYRDFDQVVLGLRDLRVSRSLNPKLQDFETWCDENKDRIPLE